MCVCVCLNQLEGIKGRAEVSQAREDLLRMSAVACVCGFKPEHNLPFLISCPMDVGLA